MSHSPYNFQTWETSSGVCAERGILLFCISSYTLFVPRISKLKNCAALRICFLKSLVELQSQSPALLFPYKCKNLTNSFIILNTSISTNKLHILFIRNLNVEVTQKYLCACAKQYKMRYGNLINIFIQQYIILTQDSESQHDPSLPIRSEDNQGTIICHFQRSKRQ